MGRPHSDAKLWARRGFRPTILLELLQLLPQSWAYEDLDWL